MRDAAAIMVINAVNRISELPENRQVRECTGRKRPDRSPL